MAITTTLPAPRWVPYLTLLLASACAQAEQADRAKPINLLAAQLERDDRVGVSVAAGSVVLSKGSILVRADKAVVREDAQGYQHAYLTAQAGQRVFFRQKRDGAADEFIQAEAETILYNGRDDAVTLIGRGQLLHFRGAVLAGELLGEHIHYDDAQGRFTADGLTVPYAPAAQPTQVRLMLVPRPVPAGDNSP